MSQEDRGVAASTAKKRKSAPPILGGILPIDPSRISGDVIAGATLAGVCYVLLNLNEGAVRRLEGLEQWATLHNPFFAGRYADLLGLIPFLLLTILLYVVGREWLLKPARR